MAMAMVKVTLTLDDETVQRVNRAAARRKIPKSQVVREAIEEYDAATGKISESERVRMLKVLDDYMAQPPSKTEAEVDAELREIRAARRTGGRLTRVE